MTLHVLIVEDEADFIDEIRHVLDEVPGTPAVQIAKSRTSAFDLLEKEFFDLVIDEAKLIATADVIARRTAEKLLRGALAELRQAPA